MRLLYRTRQFWLALGGRPKESELALARQVLTPAQMALFASMQPGEQVHALQVLQRLLEQGERHPDLLAAALLHDCGKQLSPLSPLERAWIVLVQRLLPSRMEGWGQAERADLGRLPAWRRPLVVAVQHPAWGAELARQAGASALLQKLIGQHQQPPRGIPQNLEDELLVLLQAADNQT